MFVEAATGTVGAVQNLLLGERGKDGRGKPFYMCM